MHHLNEQATDGGVLVEGQLSRLYSSKVRVLIRRYAWSFQIALFDKLMGDWVDCALI